MRRIWLIWFWFCTSHPGVRIHEVDPEALGAPALDPCEEGVCSAVEQTEGQAQHKVDPDYLVEARAGGDCACAHEHSQAEHADDGVHALVSTIDDGADAHRANHPAQTLGREDRADRLDAYLEVFRNRRPRWAHNVD